MQVPSHLSTQDRVILPLQDWVSTLGVHLVSQVFLENKVIAVARSVFAQFQLVCHLLWYLSQSDLTHDGR